MRTWPPLKDRLLAKIDTSNGPNACWPWIGKSKVREYGQISIGTAPNRKSLLAHRVAYEIFIGPIPDHMHVCHSCDNPSCCNPSHLWLGTHQQNILDARDKGRLYNTNGAQNGAAKLTISQVSEIRKLKGILPSRRVGKLYNVSKTPILHIWSGKSWK